MQILFLEEAQQELDDAVFYYNQELSGLGAEFLDEILKTLERVANFPHAWHPYSNRTRRCQAKRFPYAVVYQMRDEKILIVAIAHLHREPEYWSKRR